MAIHDQAIKNLPPADYLLIEKEHAQLERFLRDLHDTCCNLDNRLSCQGCSSEQLATCKGRLPSFFFDLINLTDKHFAQEESVMLSMPHVTEEYDNFRMHRQAHANIMQELNKIVRECTSLAKLRKTANSYRHLYINISDLFEDHDQSFDDPFIQSTIRTSVVLHSVWNLTGCWRERLFAGCRWLWPSR